MKTKHIFFKVNLEGNGVFNRNDKAVLWNEKRLGFCLFDEIHRNVLVAKKRLVKTKTESAENGSERLVPQVFVSSNCIRDLIFSYDSGGDCLQTAINYCPAGDRNLLYGTFEGLVRGYVHAETSTKRKSPLSVTDARQVGGSELTLEVQTTKGPRDENSLVYAETLGDVSYEAVGFLDLSELSFVSCSDIFDRRAVDVDRVEDFKAAVAVSSKCKETLGLGYFCKSTSSSILAEYGIKMSKNHVSALAIETLSRVLGIFGTRRGGYIKAVSVDVELILEDGDRKKLGNFTDKATLGDSIRKGLESHEPWSSYVEALPGAQKRTEELQHLYNEKINTKRNKTKTKTPAKSKNLVDGEESN